MTLNQRIALSVGMLLFSLMGLMPPWVHVQANDPSSRVPVGYAFITVGVPIRPDTSTGPGDPRRRGRFRRTYRGTPLRFWSSEIDARRLALQWSMVAVTTGAAIWLVGTGGARRRTGEQPDATRSRGPSRPR